MACPINCRPDRWSGIQLLFLRRSPHSTGYHWGNRLTNIPWLWHCTVKYRLRLFQAYTMISICMSCYRRNIANINKTNAQCKHTRKHMHTYTYTLTHTHAVLNHLKPAATTSATRFKIRKFHVPPTQCVYAFHTALTTNNDCLYTPRNNWFSQPTRKVFTTRSDTNLSLQLRFVLIL